MSLAGVGTARGGRAGGAGGSTAVPGQRLKAGCVPLPSQPVLLRAGDGGQAQLLALSPLPTHTNLQRFDTCVLSRSTGPLEEVFLRTNLCVGRSLT